MNEETSPKTDLKTNPDGSITLDDITIPAAPTPALTVDATKERLIITELLVRDFKSYAGTHTLGPFNKNFTCIVGPNGSGKSNVIDALLFVFGYRAQKIRSKKVSVLIHKSHKYPDLNSCSITVNFAMIKDEGVLGTILPDSKFSVSRTGFKDNSSTYEINGRRSQYKDVANLLKSYGIDLEYNRFMILQGEIELISMMKPKGVTEQDTGMLEYIEDIIGSHRFIQPIQHFHSKMEESNEKRLEKLNNLKIVEKERADTEKPRNLAMQYLELANNLTLLQNDVLQAEINTASNESKRLAEIKNSLTEKVNELTVSLEEIQAGKTLKEVELENLMSDYEKCAAIVKEFQEEFTALEHADTACRENLKNNKEKLKKIAKILQAEKIKLEKLKKLPEQLSGEIGELEEKKKKLELSKSSEEEKLAEVMGSMKNEIQGFQDEKDNFENELVGLKKIENQEKSLLDLAKSELDICLSSERKEKEKLEALQKECDRVSSSLDAEKSVINKTPQRLSEIESKMKSAEQELVEIKKTEILLNEKLKEFNTRLNEAENSLTTSQNRSAVTRAFLEQKKKGNLIGVYGRLGDLGAIDSKFDVAISTACGALDHIVTDTMVTAQECVKFLKQNKLGYATFIALDKMTMWEPYTTQKISTPENVPRLFDLISVKDKDVLPAFYFALRNTLVANNLEQATRVGLQGSSRYRVVTLKGDLIDLSGTMTGGGNKVCKGRMGQAVIENSISQEEIDKLSKEVNILETKLADIKRLKLELEENIESDSKEINILHRSSKKSQMNYDGYIEQVKNLKRQIKEQEKKIIEVVPDEAEVKKLNKKIDLLQKNYDKAVNAASVVETKVKSIQNQILTITKGKYGSAQKKIDTLVKEISKVAENITKNKALLKNNEKNFKQVEDKVSSLEQDMEKCENEKVSLNEEFKSLEVKGVEVSEKKNEAYEVLKEKETIKMIITTEIKSLTTAMNQIKSEILVVKNKIKLNDREESASQGCIKRLKAELAKLELHEIENGPTELPTLTTEEIYEININDANYKIGKLQNKMKDMNPDLKAIAEFKRKDEIYREKLKDLEETVAERDHYRQYYETLRKLRLQEFMRGFNIITLKVKELYQMMTQGGDAELELVDSLDPFSEGIEYSVRPLRKSWKMVRNLSGGEKTLSSLSLVFALHYYRTTPFFVMDEIDAALDFRNVSIIGSYIKDCTKNAQFIVISLRENMFLLADHLVGIYKTNNRTKNVYFSLPEQTEVADDSITELTKGKKTAETKNFSDKEKSTRVTFKTPDKVNSSNTSPRNTSQTSRVRSFLSDNSNVYNNIINVPPSKNDSSGKNDDSLIINVESLKVIQSPNLSKTDDSLVIGDDDKNEM